MKQDLQKKWMERIDRAKKARQEWSDKFRVDMAREYFDGQQNPGYPDDEWITINKIYSHLMSQLPSLYSVDPYFYIKPKRVRSVDPREVQQLTERGRVRQAMLNYYKTELQLKKKARQSIKQAHFAYGALKVRYVADETASPNAGKPILDENGDPMLNESGEQMLYPDVIPVNGRYAIDWVDCDDLLFDEDAGPMEDSWGWVAQLVKTPKKRALKNKRYPKKVIEGITGRKKDDEKKNPSKIMQFFAGKQDSPAKDDEILYIWEIYDLEKNEWLTIAEDAEEVLIKPEKTPKGIEKHPFSILRFSPLQDKSVYPMPPMSTGIDPQKEYNLSRSRILTHRKRFNRKYEVNVNQLADESELSKLESGEDGTMIKVMQMGAVNPIKDAPLDQQTYQELALLNNDLVEVLGSPDTVRGIASADSATEASIMDSRLEIREGDRMSEVIDFILETGRKLDQLIQAHIEGEEAVRIAGPQGERWVRIRDEDYESLSGEFEYTMNVGASRPRLPDIERSQWIAFMSQVIIPFPQILTAPSAMKRMAEMFHIEDEAFLEEMRQLGLKMLSGQMPMPGKQGSQPGVSENNPVAAIMGAAMGQTGGNTNGGGSQLQ